MRVVVLDGDEAEPPLASRGEERRRQRPFRLVPRRRAERPAGREVVGVEVVGDGDRLGLPEAEEVGDDALEGGERLGRLEVADVLREDDLAAEAEADDVLEVRADGEDRREPRGDRDGQRREAARAAQELELLAVQPGDAVVGVPLDGAVVDEEEVGEMPEPRDRLAPRRSRSARPRGCRSSRRAARRRPRGGGGGAASRGASRRGASTRGRRSGRRPRTRGGGGGGSAPPGRGATARPRPRPRRGRARRRRPSP